MLRTYTHSGIHVVQELRDRDALNVRLKQLDERLFIEMQMVLSGELVWCVMLDVGLREPPRCVLEWRDDQGEPITHLSDGIVQEIERMMRRGPLDMAAIDEANRQLVARREAESSEAYHEIARDFERLAKKQFVTPRSPALTETRRRQRRTQPPASGQELP